MTLSYGVVHQVRFSGPPIEVVTELPDSRTQDLRHSADHERGKLRVCQGLRRREEALSLPDCEDAEAGGYSDG